MKKLGKLTFTGLRKLKDGTYRGTFKKLPDKVYNALYEQAIRDNNLTLKELVFQVTQPKRISFKDAVVAAHILQLIQDAAERTLHESERQTEKPKTL
jgi:hypothetical protein